MLGDHGGTLIVLHGTDRVGSISWREVQTGPTAFNLAIGVGLAPEFRGRGYGSAAQQLLVRYLFAHTQANRIEASRRSLMWLSSGPREGRVQSRGHPARHHVRQGRWHDQGIYSVLREEVNLEDSVTADGPV